jgi:DNA-binding MarR family transcriptional regulator
MLRHIGAAGGAAIGELGEALRLDRSTATRNVEALKRAGYVRLISGDGDRRKKILSLSDAGRAKLSEAIPLWKEAQDHILRELGEDGAENFLSILRDIAAIEVGRSEENE